MRKTISTAVLAAAIALSLTACGGEDSSVSTSDRDKATEAALAATGGGAVSDADRGDSDDGYAYEVEVTFSNGADVDVELDENFNVTNSPPKASDFASEAAPSSDPASAPARSRFADDRDDRPLRGETLKKASEAALEATDGGKVIETGGSDDRDHAYEVEVLLGNGEDVSVELDKKFKVTEIDH